MQLSLNTLVVVIIDIILDCLDQRFPLIEFSAIIRFSFQNAPEPFHRPVIDTMRNTRHALLHVVFFRRVENIALVY